MSENLKKFRVKVLCEDKTQLHFIHGKINMSRAPSVKKQANYTRKVEVTRPIA